MSFHKFFVVAMAAALLTFGLSSGSKAGGPAEVVSLDGGIGEDVFTCVEIPQGFCSNPKMSVFVAVSDGFSTASAQTDMASACNGTSICGGAGNGSTFAAVLIPADNYPLELRGILVDVTTQVFAMGHAVGQATTTIGLEAPN